MTARETAIAKKILNYLHDLDGGQAHALTIHAEIGGMAVCGQSEFDSILEQIDTRKWIISVKTKFKGVMHSISDAGEAARLEM